MAVAITKPEAERIQAYLRSKLNDGLIVTMRRRPDSCAEIYLGAECLGVVEKIVDEGETSYSIEISVLEDDLEDA